MSVARCREINARLRAAGITVHEWPGADARGNGQTSAYEGGIIHHTASAYGFAYQGLVTGRPDLAGPLCNWAGNEDGSLTYIAAHPANHAGASGGRSMGPLPTTTLFNKRVMGLEIVYPGTAPMRPAQYRTACRWARVVADVVGFGDIQRVRAHAETSLSGKWDPGYAINRTIDMGRFRVDAALGIPSQEDNVSWDKKLQHPGTGHSDSAANWLMGANERAEKALAELSAQRAQIAGLATAVDRFAEAYAAGRDDLTAEELKQAMREVMAEVVHVEITVDDRAQGPTP